MSPKIKLYGAVAGILALSIAGFAVVRALSSVDSNIATVTTKSVSSPASTYIGQCITKSTSTITVSWTRSDATSPATALLYGDNALNGVRAATNPLTSAPAAGSYDDSGLNPGTQRWYRVDTAPGSGSVVTGAPFTCTTNSIASDVPTKLGIFANSPSIIFFNWKDNSTSTASYSFEVQRIRATPETPSSTATSSPVLAHEVSFKWNVEGKFTPYETVIERSTSTADRFNPKKDLSLASFHTGQWNDPLTTNTYASFSYSDISVQDATMYFYRFKTCSLIQVADLYGKAYTGVEELNPSETKPSPVCSAYKPSDSGMTIMTPPAAPSDLIATASSTSVINLSWVNHSVNADGYEIQRSKGGTSGYAPLTTVGKTTTFYRDSGLDAGTHYFYRIRSYKDFGGGIKLYSTPTVDWIAADAYTWFTITASVVSDNAGGEGSVRSSPAGINCSSSCSASFPWGTQVGMSALPVLPDSSFVRWTGDCSGSSCTVTANADIVAHFVNLCADVTCADQCSGSTFLSGGYCSGGSCSYPTRENNSPRCGTSPSTCTTDANCTPYCGGTGNTTYFSNGTCNIVPPATSGTCSYASSTPNAPACSFGAIWPLPSSDIAREPGSESIAEVKTPIRRISLTATIADAAQEVGNTIWESLTLAWGTLTDGVNRLISLVGEKIPVAEGQSTSIDYDKYFLQTPSFPTPIPSLKNTGLRTDTVYIYRVRVNYGGKTSEWSEMIAGKTLGDVPGINKIPGVSGVCINNSYCQQVVTEVPKYQHQYVDPNDPTKTLTERSELQCKVNADCRNVGRSSQIFEEQ